jgi:hypothetical protein
MAGDTDKAALIAEIAATRARMTVATSRLQDAMDFPARARESLQRNRWKWLGGAVAAGAALVLLRRGKKIVYVERSTGELLGAAGKAGLLWTGLKLFGTLARPALTELAKTRLAKYAANHPHLRRYFPSEPDRHS